MMLLNVFRYKDYNVSRVRAVLYTIVTYVYGVLGALAMGNIYSAVCVLVGADDESNVAIFGAVVFTPLMLLVTALIEKAVLKRKTPGTYKNKHGKEIQKEKRVVSLRDTMDLLTPGIPNFTAAAWLIRLQPLFTAPQDSVGNSCAITPRKCGT